MSGEAPHEIYDRRRGRNLAVALAAAGLVALLFAVTLVKLGGNAASPFAERFNPGAAAIGGGQ